MIFVFVLLAILAGVVWSVARRPPRALRALRAILAIACALTLVGAGILAVSVADTVRGDVQAELPVRYTQDPTATAGATSTTSPDNRVTMSSDSTTYERGNLKYSVETMRRGSVTITVPNIADGLLYLSWYALLLIATFTTSFLLLRLVEDAIEGEPFSRKNIRRLRIAGALMVIFGVTSPILLATTRTVLLNHVTTLSVEPPHMALLDLRFFIPGVAVLALAEVFKRGTALREQEALTI
ncbi:MAG: DUF2975 domain-containing protein [Acidimicrobiia bacterium]